MEKIVECVPNFSEGRDKSILDAISSEINKVNGVKLLNVDPGSDTNRTVFTFIGSPETIGEAAFLAIKKAFELIDMSKHSGAHPRIGACDVCPFIPVKNVTMDECVSISKRLAERVGRELSVPVYLYEYAASKEEWKNLANIRQGEYEGLKDRFKDSSWRPDFGPSKFVPSFGAMVTGAREFLIAYNVNINTRDKSIPNKIAQVIREQGKQTKDEKGNIINIPGKLKNVKAIGWYIKEYGAAQISINLTNYKVTPLHILFEECKKEAEQIGAVVTGSEIVGLVPMEVLINAGKYYLEKQGKSAGVPQDELIHIAIKSLGLNDIAPFKPNERILDKLIEHKGELVSMSVTNFVDEISMDSPAPGGGSVAALCGSMAAALSAMVANLTVGKKGYELEYPFLKELALKAQVLKKELCEGVDKDTDAFNSVIAARRLPKVTEEEQKIRNLAIEEGFKLAVSVPFSVAKRCLDVMKLSLEAMKRGNKNSITDAAVGVLCAQTGLTGAIYNVKINFASIKDDKFKSEIASQLSELEKKAKEIANSATELVNKAFVN